MAARKTDCRHMDASGNTCTYFRIRLRKSGCIRNCMGYEPVDSIEPEECQNCLGLGCGDCVDEDGGSDR